MHEGFNSVLKMKRKDIDEVNDEFCDFSLSSPARKIRRLVIIMLSGFLFSYYTIISVAFALFL